MKYLTESMLREVFVALRTLVGLGRSEGPVTCGGLEMN